MRAYRGTLSIPYVTASGDVVGIKFRYLDGEHKKRYTATTGFEPKRLYNPKILTTKHRKIYVTEGEIDTITLHILRVPGIAIPGSTNWNPVASRALRNRRVVVLADGDDSLGEGMKLGKQITRSVEDSSIILMEGTDVNQYYLDHGAEALLNYIGWTDG